MEKKWAFEMFCQISFVTEEPFFLHRRNKKANSAVESAGLISQPYRTHRKYRNKIMHVHVQRPPMLTPILQTNISLTQWALEYDELSGLEN
jgi:hypothetical protein